MFPGHLFCGCVAWSGNNARFRGVGGVAANLCMLLLWHIIPTLPDHYI